MKLSIAEMRRTGDGPAAEIEKMQLAGFLLACALLLRFAAVVYRRRMTARRAVAAVIANTEHSPRLAKCIAVAKGRAWKGTRRFVVASQKREAEGIVSLRLLPEDGHRLPEFRPGQFLTLQLQVPGRSGPVVRCYSLSSAPGEDSYRITVKRVPGGIASNHLYDHLTEGMALEAMAPAGEFVLDRTDSRPVILISGGIGITPFVSMLHAIAETPRREAILFHSVRNGRKHAFAAELEALARRCPRIRLFTIYTAPEANDILGVDYVGSNRLTARAVQSVFPSLEAEFYLCGPPEMNDSFVSQLTGCGVPRERIHTEGFGQSQPSRPTSGSPAILPARDLSAKPADCRTITFRKSGRTVLFNPCDTSILTAAEQHNVCVESMCRTGNCGACQVKLLHGAVTYAEEPRFPVPDDACLPCVARPAGDIVLHA